MCLDFVVMCLSAYKLAWTPARNGTGTHTKLIKMLFSDGLIYFFIAYVAFFIFQPPHNFLFQVRV